jgi:hypothetical protein
VRERKTDEHDQPRYAEPGEQIADRGIDRAHTLHGDVGHQHEERGSGLAWGMVSKFLIGVRRALLFIK